MKAGYIFWVSMVVMFALALGGCKKAEPTAVAAVDESMGGLPASGPRGLDGVNGLALGTLKLEGSEDALTPMQAAELLPLWEMIRGRALQGDAETEAVLKQIEHKMTASQVAAIEGMELTWQDVGTWMQEQGIEMPAPPQGQQGGGGAFQNMSEEERAQMRQDFQDMTQEQRATRMAELGFQRPQGQGGGPDGAPGARPGGGMQGGSVLLEPLVTLLSERATQ